MTRPDRGRCSLDRVCELPVVCVVSVMPTSCDTNGPGAIGCHPAETLNRFGAVRGNPEAPQRSRGISASSACGGSFDYRLEDPQRDAAPTQHQVVERGEVEGTVVDYFISEVQNRLHTDHVAGRLAG